MSNKKKAALILLWAEGVIALAIIIFNVWNFVHPPSQDFLLNGVIYIAMVTADIAIVKVFFLKIIPMTIRLVSLIR